VVELRQESEAVAGVEDAGVEDAGGYRYPGSPPFADTELDRMVFKGRADEADTVLHSILSSDLFVLYAVSGMGKTSVLNAGVLHHLRQRDLMPIVLRLNDPAKTPLELIAADIQKTVNESPDVDVRHRFDDGSEEAGDLWDLLAGLELWRGNSLLRPVLIFDQFEELFTLDWSDEQRATFIREFGEIVRRHQLPDSAGAHKPGYTLPPPRVKIVLVIREDAIGELEAFIHDVPQIMRHRFRLEGLNPQQAEDAIREPAKLTDERLASEHFTYSQDAAVLMLNFLRTQDQRGKPVLTANVDPPQLQIICQHIERTIVPAKLAEAEADEPVEITEADLGGPDGLNAILRDFYRSELDSFPPTEREHIRDLCETGLISSSSRRRSLEREQIKEDFAVSPATLEQLVRRRLLRGEDRVGSVYYELAHDSLVAPILAYREQQAAERHDVELRDRWLLGLGILALLMALLGVVITIRADYLQNDLRLAAPILAVLVGAAAILNFLQEPHDRGWRWASAVAAACCGLALVAAVVNDTVIGAGADVRGLTAARPQATIPVVSTQIVEFGDVVVGATSSQAVTITNGSDEAWAVDSIEVAEGHITTEGCTGMLPAQEQCELTVTTAPTAEGTIDDIDDTVTVSMTAASGELGAQYEIVVTAFGVAYPVASVESPTEGDIGSTIVGGEAVLTTVTVSNDSTRPIVVLEPAISGGTSFTTSDEGCKDTEVGPGASCDLGISFAPDEVGTITSALVVGYRDRDSGDDSLVTVLEATLEGVGAPQPPTSSATDLNFGTVTRGGSSIANQVRLDYEDDDQTRVFSVTVTDGEQFQTFGEPCDASPCFIDVVFSPQSDGFSQATLDVHWEAANGDPYIASLVSLTGTGAAPIAEPEDAEFFEVGTRPVAVAVGHDSVWVTNMDDGTVTRLALDGELIYEIGLGTPVDGVAVDDQGSWVVGSEGILFFIDADTGAVSKKITLGMQATKVAVGTDAIWVTANQDDVILRVDRETEQIESIPVGIGPVDIAIGAGAIWVTNRTANTVSRYDPADRTVIEIEVGTTPLGIAAGEEFVWVANFGDDSITRIDHSSCDGIRCLVHDTFEIGDGPDGVAIGDEFVWVTISRGDSVVRVDRDLGIESVRVGSVPDGIDLSGRAVWVTNSGDNTVTRLQGG
jgi:streptogramin lyase